MSAYAREQILSKLIGFAGAVSSGFKTEHTDDAVIFALSHLTIISNDSAEKLLEMLENEKFTVSPNCAHCTHRCGNTSDFDMTKYYESTAEILQIKEMIIDQLVRIATACMEGISGPFGTEGLKTANDTEDITIPSAAELPHYKELPEDVYKGLSFLAYDLGMDSYANLLDTLEKI